MGTVLGKQPAAAPSEAGASASRMGDRQEDSVKYGVVENFVAGEGLPSLGSTLAAGTDGKYGVAGKNFVAGEELSPPVSILTAGEDGATENSVAGGLTTRSAGHVSAKLFLRVLHNCPDQLSWIKSKLGLRTTSWECGVAYQERCSLAMRVEKETPLRILWVPNGPRVSSRVPGVRPVKLKWYDNPEHFEGRHCTQLLHRVSWANSLVSVTIERRFKEPISDVSWPPRLEVLKLGFMFQQPIFGAKWPSTLKELDLGDWYQALSGVKFPDSLFA